MKSKFFHSTTLAKPSGPCTQFCGKMGFDETSGMCPDHYYQFVITPLESGLRESNQRWRAAVEAEHQLKEIYYCTCGFRGDYFARDKHFVVMGEGHQPRSKPTFSETKSKSSSIDANKIEEIG